MKSLGIIIGVIVLAMGMAATTSADERAANVSESSLAAMGFGGVSHMSDEEGIAIRGKGASFVNFWKGNFGRNGFGKGDFGKNNHHGFNNHFGCVKNGRNSHGCIPVPTFCKFGGGHRVR